MVDWGLGGRGGELQVDRMHAADKQNSRLPLVIDMSREDESDLNVMDFVETEYKSDVGDGGEQGKSSLKRKKVHSRLRGHQGKGDGASRLREESDLPGDGGKTAYKRRKRKHTHRQVHHGNSVANVGLHYPYAAFLKNLCDKVGSSQDTTESLPNKIFSQLRHSDVHYPYASLLQALHRHAGVSAGVASSPSRGEPLQSQASGTLEVARVMRNLHYPTTSSEVGMEDTDSPSTLFSTLLMMMVMQQKMHTCTTSQAGPTGPGWSVGGIGEILRREMPQSRKDDPPPSELSSASLLQKLSLSVERDLGTAGSRGSLPGAQQVPVWSSTESSQGEEEDLDWRPTHWLAKKVSIDATTPVKRKSVRKKKSLDCELEQEQPNTSQGSMGERRTGLQRCSASEAARAKLLQFIMDRRQGISEKTSKKARKRAKVARKKGKRKHVNNAQRYSIDCGTKLPSSGLTEGQATSLEGEGNHSAVGEPQSLLKEYLLKPAGEEVVPSENCDIPKLETNFLFSRLLQNFKNLAESSQPGKAEKIAESCCSPSILRGMLAATGAVDEPEKKFCPSDCQSASLSSLGRQQQQQQQPHSPPPLNEPHLRVKLEKQIKVECEEEEILCKIECEEDGFECQVCHLQFSSLSDLSNHQVLFHCIDDPPASTASHRLLGCSVEGLAGGVMQGKQPA